MRIYSYLFHAILAFALSGIALVALLTGHHNLQISLLPWQGKALTLWMLFSGLFAFASIGLAMLGKLRILFLLWSAAVVLMLIRGYIFSPYYFGGLRPFLNALVFLAAALLAALGAWLRFRQTATRRPA